MKKGSEKVKEKLEQFGHTQVTVWYQQVRNSPIMEGMVGGYFFKSRETCFTHIPLYSPIKDALIEVEGYDARGLTADEQTEIDEWIELTRRET